MTAASSQRSRRLLRYPYSSARTAPGLSRWLAQQGRQSGTVPDLRDLDIGEPSFRVPTLFEGVLFSR